MAELELQLEEIDAELYRVNQDYLFTKAEYDAERYEFEEIQEEDPERAAGLRPILVAQSAAFTLAGWRARTPGKAQSME